MAVTRIEWTEGSAPVEGETTRIVIEDRVLSQAAASAADVSATAAQSYASQAVIAQEAARASLAVFTAPAANVITEILDDPTSAPAIRLSATFDVGTLMSNPTFGAALDGTTDDAAALRAAHDALPAGGGRIIIPVGNMRVASTITFTKTVILEGLSVSSLQPTSGSIITLAGATSLVFSGAGSGVRDLLISGETGNTGPGLLMVCDRPFVENVTATKQGGHGIQFGRPDVYVNVNSGYLANIRSKGNGGDGLWIGNINRSNPDANAITVINADLSYNTGNGLTLDGSIDNTFIGLHSEGNSGWGVKMLFAISHQFTKSYIEFNTLGVVSADADSYYNYFLGGRRDDSVVLYEFANAQNMVLGRDFANGLFPFTNRSYFEKLGVSAQEISGAWEMTQNPANRNLEINLAATTAAATVRFVANGAATVASDKLLLGSDVLNTIQAVRRIGATLNVGSVPANSTVEKTITLASALVADVIAVSPNVAPPVGLSWCAYVATAGVVTVRISNATTAAIAGGSMFFKGTVTTML